MHEYTEAYCPCQIWRSKIRYYCVTCRISLETSLQARRAFWSAAPPRLSCFCSPVSNIVTRTISWEGTDIVPPCRYRVRGCDIVVICDAVGRAVISYIARVHRPAISHDAAWYRAFPRCRGREARYRGAGPDIAARTDDIVRFHDIVPPPRQRTIP